MFQYWMCSPGLKLYSAGIFFFRNDLPCSLSLLSFCHSASHWGQHVELVISHHTPLCLNRADYMMAVIYTSQSYSHSWNRSPAINSAAHRQLEGFYLTGNGQKQHISPDQMRSGAVLPLEYELVIGIFVCDNDSPLTHFGKGVKTLTVSSRVPQPFEKYDLGDNESQSHNYWEQFLILLLASQIFVKYLLGPLV